MQGIKFGGYVITGKKSCEAKREERESERKRERKRERHISQFYPLSRPHPRLTILESVRIYTQFSPKENESLKRCVLE